MAALWKCDVDKWAITAAIFTCHIWGRPDPPLAPDHAPSRSASVCLSIQHQWRQLRTPWHLIHHHWPVSLSHAHSQLTSLRMHQPNHQTSHQDTQDHTRHRTGDSALTSTMLACYLLIQLLLNYTKIYFICNIVLAAHVTFSMPFIRISQHIHSKH